MADGGGKWVGGAPGAGGRFLSAKAMEVIGFSREDVAEDPYRAIALVDRARAQGIPLTQADKRIQQRRQRVTTLQQRIRQLDSQLQDPYWNSRGSVIHSGERKQVEQTLADMKAELSRLTQRKAG